MLALIILGASMFVENFATWANFRDILKGQGIILLGAMGIGAEAIDRLHTTATSHHRIIVCEVMGHNAGWLALGAGIAGGADAILIPEIPYDLAVVAEHLLERRRSGKRFSIIAVAEGAVSRAEASARLKKNDDRAKRGKGGNGDEEPDGVNLVSGHVVHL